MYFSVLDSFLPRVVELAMSSVNRQTKVVACELLHAMVLFMIGKSVHVPIQQAKKVIKSLFIVLFNPICAKLSTVFELRLLKYNVLHKRVRVKALLGKPSWGHGL